jgi:penicillin-binding protein 2
VFRKKRRLEMAKPGERRKAPRDSNDDVTLSRRLLLVRGTVGAGFVALGGKLWQMQIAEGTDYEDEAEGNSLRFERLKSARGRITDRLGRPLAENRRTWTVRIIPNLLPSDTARREQVLETVSEALKLGFAVVLDRASVPLGSETAVANSVAKLVDVDSERLVVGLSRTDAVMVPIKHDLEDAEAVALVSRLKDIPGVRKVTMLNYALKVHGFSELPMVVKQEVDRDTAMSIAANTLYLPGVVVDDDTLIREYRGGKIFSHILGYVGPISETEYDAATTVTGTPIYDQDDNVGRGGVEGALEQELRGTKGGRWVQVDSGGVERFELLDQRRNPVSGLSVQLTIDMDFQKIVAEALQEGIEFADDEAVKEGRERVGAGVAIAMNPQNGEIQAMVSLPSYDNQEFIGGISQAKYNEYLGLDPDGEPLPENNFQPLLNRAISGLFAPGSVIKPLMACAALQSGVVKPDDTFKCLGSIRVPWTWDESQGNDYVCWLPQGHGDVDIYKSIADSCDIYYYNVGAPGGRPEGVPGADYVHYYNPDDPERQYFRGMGIDQIAHYLKDVFGYGSPTGIELSGEEEGVVPDQGWLFRELGENWSIGDTINVSIGQGHLLNTPLQMLNATAAIANGGSLYRPRLIKALTREDGTVVREYPPRLLRELQIEDEYIQIVREGMRQTITSPSGTGHRTFTFSDPPVAGKSGTAEYGVAVDGLYKKSHAWFTAFGPYENPEIAVVVLIVTGNAGSTYAGPVANKIIDAYFHGGWKA